MQPFAVTFTNMHGHREIFEGLLESQLEVNGVVYFKAKYAPEFKTFAFAIPKNRILLKVTHQNLKKQGKENEKVSNQTTLAPSHPSIGVLILQFR